MAHATVKLSKPIVDDAREKAKINSRSIAGQIEHWIKIGRAIERSPSFDHARVEAALRADIAYDALSADERDIFDERLFANLGNYDEKTKSAYAKLGARESVLDNAKP